VDWCYLTLGMLFVTLQESMLFGELAEAEDDWLWRNDMTDNRPELGLGCFGRLVVERAKDRMESIGGGGSPFCDVVDFPRC
jgi:hypothetical protein